MPDYLHYPKMLFKELFFLKKDKTLCVPEIGWKLTLPKKFQLLSEKELKTMSKRTEKVLDMILERKVQYPKRLHFFMAHYQVLNKIGCSIASLNDLPENDWEDQNEDIFNRIKKLYHYRYRDFAHVTVHSETGVLKKDNIVFKARDIYAVTPTRELYRSRLYSTVYKNLGILVTMAFAEEKIGEELLGILRNSTFD